MIDIDIDICIEQMSNSSVNPALLLLNGQTANDENDPCG